MTTSTKDELASLLDAERGRPSAGLQAADRVWSGVQGRLGGGPPPASVPSGSGWGPLTAVAGSVLVAGLLAAGWGLSRSQSVPHFDATPPAPSLKVSLKGPVVPSLHAELPRERVAAVLESGDAAPPDPARRKNQGSIADELALIERARTSLDRGNTKTALGTLKEHRRKFPKGAFREEASALRASALCKSGRGEAAAKASAAFLRRYPKSVHASRVRACDE
ncbi:MAG: hypothetical protein KUG77_20815 [Nannocystaceae bacterium]|nr:hypothetical protein [Nannocystaceae bacterium]